ncbi:hypothetical protein QOZ80_5BG0416060 [Eleusine coracana subsp. coracana]|nr:hypothetical protein QOZ80_5BG0416060 [Eleusine coracana subsp. coracana]
MPKHPEHISCGGIHDAPCTSSSHASPSRSTTSSTRTYLVVVASGGRENNLKYIELARFAVTEHNSKTNGMLEFERLVKVRTQVVAGVLYYFTVEVKEGGTKKLYESTVWETNLKTLTSFRPIATETTAAALHKLTSLLHIFMLR